MTPASAVSWWTITSGFALPHGLGDLVGIKRVRDHRHSAQPGEHRLLRLAPRHAMNLMTRGDQTRHQLRSDRSRRTCHKHSHRQLLSRITSTSQDKTAAPAATPPSAQHGNAGDITRWIQAASRAVATR